MGRVLDKIRLENGSKEIWGWIIFNNYRVWGYLCLCKYLLKNVIYSKGVFNS